MFPLGNARIIASNPCSGFRRVLSIGLQGFATVLLAGIAIGPVLAQASSQPASGSAQKEAGPTKRTVKPSGSSRSTSPRSGSMTRRGSNNTVVTPSQVVLVFPTDAKGGVSDQISDVITDTVQGRLAASGKYQSVYFLRSIPMVQRAVNEATLTPNEVSHPYDDDAKLRKLMPLTGYDTALTTSIDSYTYDEAKNQVTMLISARLIDFRGAKSVARAAAENGSSTQTGGNVREIVLATQVARNLADKLISSLLSQEKPASGSTPAAPSAATGNK